MKLDLGHSPLKSSLCGPGLSYNNEGRCITRILTEESEATLRGLQALPVATAVPKSPERSTL